MDDADALEQGIHNALAAHDVKAAVEILEGLIRLDMERGLRVYREIQDALTVQRVLFGRPW